MSEFQKQLYNTWLITNRKCNNKPFRVRKDFTELDDQTKNYLYIIEKRINRLKIEAEQYFKAPFELWQDTNYMPLKWYTTHKAVVAWKKIFANQ